MEQDKSAKNKVGELVRESLISEVSKLVPILSISLSYNKRSIEIFDGLLHKQ